MNAPVDTQQAQTYTQTNTCTHTAHTSSPIYM